MNSKQRVLNTLRRQPADAVPFVETRVDPALQEALLGRKLNYPARITGTTNLSSVEINDLLGLDNFQVRFLPPIFAGSTGSSGETYDQPWIRSRDDLAKMVFPDPEDPALYRDAEALIRAGGHRYAVGATLRSGISATTMSFGLEGLSYALADDPGLVNTVLGRYTDWAIAVSRHLRGIGVDFVWTADDMAYKTGPMFSPAVFRAGLQTAAGGIRGRHPGRGFSVDSAFRRQRPAAVGRPDRDRHPGPAPDRAGGDGHRQTEGHAWRPRVSGRQHRLALHAHARHARRRSKPKSDNASRRSPRAAAT